MGDTTMASLKDEYPIESQTSLTDKSALLQVRSILKKTVPSYKYLEIGSFMGGSLSPFLKDPQCSQILSVDERNRQQPDERGMKFDYSGITNQTMIDNLKNHGFDVRKLKTFDGSISEYQKAEDKFDLVFIDGEHTDFACFRDFIHSYRLLSENSVIVFHDSSLIYKSLRIIQEFLIATKERFRFIKVKDSDVSCIFRNSFSVLKLEGFFEIENDLSAFYQNSEVALLTAVIQNRVEISFKLKDTPIGKAY
jgi:Methyltransferase domain